MKKSVMPAKGKKKVAKSMPKMPMGSTPIAKKGMSVKKKGMC